MPGSSSSVEAPVGLGARREPLFASDVVVDVLAHLGCRYVSLNPGSSFRGLHDSLVNHGGNRDPQLLLCLHEEIAVALAHGYAKASGTLAVAAVHDLVGLMHASMGVYDAWCDRVPLLLLGGGGPRDTTRRRAIDWAHSASAQAELVRDFTKWDDEPASVAALAESVQHATSRALTVPQGPVYVTLDSGLQEQRLEDPPPTPPAPVSRAAAPAAAPAALDAALDLLIAAEAPVLLAGVDIGLDPTVTPLVLTLAERLGLGLLEERSVAVVPTDHPSSLTGSTEALARADVVLAVGVRTLPPTTARVIDVSAAELAVRGWSSAGAAPRLAEVTLLADPLTVLGQMEAATGVRGKVAGAAARRQQLAGEHRRLRSAQAAEVRRRWEEQPIAPPRLAAELWEAVREEPWLLTLRNTRSWVEGIWRFTGAGQYLGHSGGGGVGYGPGAMVGGALAARDRGELGVAIIGDGDLLMAPGALWTAVHYGIPLLAVVNDNRSFFNDELHQRHMAETRGRPPENSWIGMRVDHPAVDIAGLARSFGAWAAGPVTDPAALTHTLREALSVAKAGGVAVVDVVTASQ